MIKNIFSSEKKNTKDEFENILNYAAEIAKRNPAALVDMVRLLGREVQAFYASSVFKREKHKTPNLDISVLWFDSSAIVTANGESLYSLKKPAAAREVLLGRDLVLTCPWHVDRAISNFCSIGPDQSRSQWKEDTLNHGIEFWLPLGIGWVLGGNHSIAVGIAQGNGKVISTEVYDISPIYEHIRCTGEAFIRNCDNKIIAPVTNSNFAAIFEIGRLMLQHGVSV